MRAHIVWPLPGLDERSPPVEPAPKLSNLRNGARSDELGEARVGKRGINVRLNTRHDIDDAQQQRLVRIDDGADHLDRATGFGCFLLQCLAGKPQASQLGVECADSIIDAR